MPTVEHKNKTLVKPESSMKKFFMTANFGAQQLLVAWRNNPNIEFPVPIDLHWKCAGTLTDIFNQLKLSRISKKYDSNLIVSGRLSFTKQYISMEEKFWRETWPAPCTTVFLLVYSLICFRKTSVSLPPISLWPVWKMSEPFVFAIRSILLFIVQGAEIFFF